MNENEWKYEIVKMKEKYYEKDNEEERNKNNESMKIMDEIWYSKKSEMTDGWNEKKIPGQWKNDDNQIYENEGRTMKWYINVMKKEGNENMEVIMCMKRKYSDIEIWRMKWQYNTMKMNEMINIQ